MAGRFTIQRTARGLLDALNMKGSGDLPHEMAPEIRGVFETSPFWLQETRRQQNLLLPNAAGTGYQSGATLLVPTGELWVVNAMSISCAPGVGAGLDFAIGYAWSQAGTLDSFAVSPYLTVPASTTAVLGVTFPLGQLLLQPSWSVGYWTKAVTGVVAGTIRLDYFRLLI